jgi:hypothetical protein
MSQVTHLWNYPLSIIIQSVTPQRPFQAQATFIFIFLLVSAGTLISRNCTASLIKQGHRPKRDDNPPDFLPTLPSFTATSTSGCVNAENLYYPGSVLRVAANSLLFLLGNDRHPEHCDVPRKW